MHTETNLTTLHEIEGNELAFVQQHRSAVWETGIGRLYLSSDPAVPTWNFIGRIDAEDEEAAVADSLAIFRDWQRPPCLKVTPMTRPAELEPLLLRSGWTAAARLTHMVLRREAPADQPAVRVRLCETDDGIRLFSEVQSRGFGDPGWVAWVQKINLINYRRPGQRFYLAEHESQPAGVCLLLTTEKVGGLYAVATLPETRGQGVARALVRRAVLDGREMGCDVFCLNTASGGPAEKVFEKLGFEAVFESRFYMRD